MLSQTYRKHKNSTNLMDFFEIDTAKLPNYEEAHQIIRESKVIQGSVCQYDNPVENFECGITTHAKNPFPHHLKCIGIEYPLHIGFSEEKLALFHMCVVVGFFRESSHNVIKTLAENSSYYDEYTESYANLMNLVELKQEIERIFQFNNKEYASYCNSCTVGELKLIFATSANEDEEISRIEKLDENLASDIHDLSKFLYRFPHQNDIQTFGFFFINQFERGIVAFTTEHVKIMYNQITEKEKYMSLEQKKQHRTIFLRQENQRTRCIFRQRNSS